MKVWICSTGNHEMYMLHEVVDSMEKAEAWLYGNYPPRHGEREKPVEAWVSEREGCTRYEYRLSGDPMIEEWDVE